MNPTIGQLWAENVTNSLNNKQSINPTQIQTPVNNQKRVMKKQSLANSLTNSIGVMNGQ